ncbi:MFS efflux transporter, putative [Paecilomyces variotii No. 5]|uniref:MFS efflux transporter, putative n=1 Tax=Byssochlamys spectabilis (strain No. 5 / NBRC 109023) TaxID=1356009 RepID=V5G4I1_BYSSN|nr:MFS efflux transporter, putative [Paecilomyces variotii No. 5]
MAAARSSAVEAARESDRYGHDPAVSMNADTHAGGQEIGVTAGTTNISAEDVRAEQFEIEDPISEARRREASIILPSISKPAINKYRVLSASLISFAGGLNDSAPGALIPYIEKKYNIGYALVSMIFVANALGFIAAAPCTHILERRLGRARTYMLAELAICAAFIALVCTPPFPVVVIAFLPIGFGLATALALSNVFCANLANGTVSLGLLHGSYGIGGTLGPLIATAIASHTEKWSPFYFVTLGMAVINTALVGWAFRGYENEVTAMRVSQSSSSDTHTDEHSHAGILKGLKNSVTILGAFFIFAYQGAEVSISGWIVSFLVTYRHGNLADVGYVSAGFWAGITAGRFLLSHPAQRFGEKFFVVMAIAGALGFQLIVWLVPNLIGEAVAVAIVGLLLGPIFPCAAAVFTKLLPRNIQMSSLSFISALGSSGGAVAPFATGLLAQKVGTFVLHPICIGLFVAMEGCWSVLPRIRKRTV